MGSGHSFCVSQLRLFMVNSMLLWWTLDSVLLPLAIKPKVVHEALQWNGERKCKVTSIKQNWLIEFTMQLRRSCWTTLLFEEQLTWRKLNMNWLFLSLSVTTIANAHKGKVWAHDQSSALWRNTRKKQTSQENDPCICPKFPKSPSL